MSDQKETVIIEKRLYSDWNVLPYFTQQNLDLGLTTHTLIVKNNGTSVCLFDDDPLQPGESKVIGAPGRNSILTGRHSIAFTGAGVNQAQVTQVYYVTPKKFESL